MTVWRVLATQANLSEALSIPQACEYNVSVAARDEWDQLLAHFPVHTLYHTMAWLRTIEEEHGAALHLARVDDAQGCVAVWPMFSTRKGPLRIVGSPVPGWCTAYLGPLFSPRCQISGAIRAILNHQEFRPGSYSFCKLLSGDLGDCIQSPAIPRWGQVNLAPFGFVEVEPFETYCIDLSESVSTIWRNLKSECRTRIRKAQKLGLQVKAENDSSFLDDFWTMSVEVFKRSRIIPPFTRTFLDRMWHNLHEAGRIMALSAYLDGERVASLILPFDAHTLYYWGGGTFARTRSLPAHNLLHWHAIDRAKQVGLCLYDFIGTLGGGGRFKRTFGPIKVRRAMHWERTSSGLVRALRYGYEQYLMRLRQTKS